MPPGYSGCVRMGIVATLAVIADELYGLPPQEFTAARNARADELRATDRGLSDAVRALRRRRESDDPA